MTANICRVVGCPCQNPVEDDPAPVPAQFSRPLPGRPMPSGWKTRVLAEIDARKRAKTQP